MPKIGGQHEAYIVRALQAYRAGERSHPSMKAIAATLSDKDIADLAAYYSRATAEDGQQVTAKAMMKKFVLGLFAIAAFVAASCRAGRRSEGRRSQGQGGLPGLPWRRRQQPERRLSEARRPVSGLSGQGAARLQVGRAQESDHGRIRRNALDGRHRQRRRLLRSATGGAGHQALSKPLPVAKRRRSRRLFIFRGAHTVLCRYSHRSTITHCGQSGFRAWHM